MDLRINPESQCSGLSQRELEVLKMIGLGLTAKDIAEQLHLSCHTISNHRKSICKKLDVHSTAQLAARAAYIRLGAW